MRVGRAVFLAGPALLLIAVLALGASFVNERRQGRRRRVIEEEPDTPASPAPRREIPPQRFAAESAVPAEPVEERLDSMRLRVDGPHGLRLRSVSVTMARSGRVPPPDEEGDGEEGQTTYELDAEEDGEFVVEEIEPGHYDVTVSAAGMAAERLVGVPSDALGVHLALARKPVLVGAIGGGWAHGCEDEFVQLEADGEAEIQTSEAGPCSFVVEGLEPGHPVRVTATVGDETDDVTVPVPVDGDPPPVCVRAPCALLPSALVVLVADGKGFLADEVGVDWATAADEDDWSSAGFGPGVAVIDGLAPGQRVRVRAYSGEQEVESVVTAATGVHEVMLTLPAGEDGDEGGDENQDEDG